MQNQGPIHSFLEKCLPLFHILINIINYSIEKSVFSQLSHNNSSISSMALIFDITKRSNNGYLYEQKIQWDQITFDVCTDYLRKVSLKVDDVKMKLGLKKIINFLGQSKALEIPHKKGILKGHENQSSSYSQFFKKVDHEQHVEFSQTIKLQSHPVTFVDVQTSKSLADENLSNHQLNDSGKENYIQTVHFSNLHYKNVETKKDLSQKTSKDIEVQANNSQLQELQRQNKVLSDCIKKVFALLEENKIIDLSKSMIKYKKDCFYQDFIEVVSQNFESYQEEFQSKIKQMTQYTKQLQKSLNIYNISINDRLQMEQSHKYQQQLASSQENPLQKSILQSRFVQVESIKSISSSEINLKKEQEVEINEFIVRYNELEEQLQRELQKVKEYEMIVHEKDQQISKMNAIICDLQDKLDAEKKPREPIVGKYKKFFQFPIQNFSKTFT